MQYIKRVPIEDEAKSKTLQAAGWKPIVAPWGNVLHGVVMVLIAIALIAINGAYLWLLADSISSYKDVTMPSRIDSFNIGNVMQSQISNFALSGLGELSAVDIGNIVRHMFIIFIAACITLTVHEWIHALCVPHAFASKKTYWGLHGVLGFVYTEEEMTRRRYLLVSVMPLLVISYLIPGILALSHQLNIIVCVLSLLNAGGACSDILNLIYVYLRVPAKGYIVSNGDESFYLVRDKS